MKPLGWALLASVCWVGLMLGDAQIIATDDARGWGLGAVLFTLGFLASGEKP